MFKGSTTQSKKTDSLFDHCQQVETKERKIIYCKMFFAEDKR